MTDGHVGALAVIGKTPLIELRRVVPAGAGRVLAKLEMANPTGAQRSGKRASTLSQSCRNR